MTSSFATFVVRRVIAAAGFVVVVSSAALLLGRLAPADATTELGLARASGTTLADAARNAGVDRSAPAQWWRWASGAVRLDFGTSTTFGLPVRGLVIDAASHTALLGALALVLATVVGVPLGIVTGARPRGVVAILVTPISIALVSCPPVVGALALLLLAASTRWLPVSSNVFIPMVALALPLAATLERLQSQATQDALSSGDLSAGAARGLPPWRLLWVHTARRSLNPVLGVSGVIIGSLFSGSLAVEAVTSWPGLGALMLKALTGRDLFLVAGCAMAGAVFLAAGNLAADLLRAWIDPRVRDA